jgi:hypothetical protein
MACTTIEMSILLPFSVLYIIPDSRCYKLCLALVHSYLEDKNNNKQKFVKAKIIKRCGHISLILNFLKNYNNVGG